jgi:hypothetical protein
MSDLLTPLRTVLFTLSGVGLAWSWYNTNKLIPVAFLAAVWVLAWSSQLRGTAKLPGKPELAVKWLEYRVVGIAAVTAATSALVVIVGVEIAAPEGGDPATKEIVTAVSSALVAFITAVAVKEDDLDNSIGEYIKSKFEAAYPVAAAAEPRVVGKTIQLPLDSAGTTAVYSTMAGGIVDWSRVNRRKRAKNLAAYLAAGLAVTDAAPSR